MVKISKTKHITKKGVVKKNPRFNSNMTFFKERTILEKKQQEFILKKYNNLKIQRNNFIKTINNWKKEKWKLHYENLSLQNDMAIRWTFNLNQISGYSYGSSGEEISNLLRKTFSKYNIKIEDGGTNFVKGVIISIPYIKGE